MDFLGKMPSPLRSPDAEGRPEGVPKELIPVQYFLSDDLREQESLLDVMLIPRSPEDMERHEEGLEAAGVKFDAEADRELTVFAISAHTRLVMDLRKANKEFTSGNYESVLQYLQARLATVTGNVATANKIGAGDFSDITKKDTDKLNGLIDILQKHLPSAK